MYVKQADEWYNVQINGHIIYKWKVGQKQTGRQMDKWMNALMDGGRERVNNEEDKDKWMDVWTMGR